MSSALSAIALSPYPLSCLAILLGASFAVAQNFRGGINGTVTDQGGATIPGAHVEITEDATGVIHIVGLLQCGRL